MCRNIKPLFNFTPPATEEEIRAAALQFVRKVSGSTRPSKANQAAFERAVDQVAAAARELLDSLVTTAPPRTREEVAAAARARSAKRFAAPRSPAHAVARPRSSHARRRGSRAKPGSDSPTSQS